MGCRAEMESQGGVELLEQYVEFSEAVGLIFTKNESEYPKTERGGSNPEWAIAHEGLLLNKN